MCRPLCFAALAILAIAPLAACNDESSNEPSADFPCTDECHAARPPPIPVPVIENRTGAPVDLVAHVPIRLVIDRRVMEGSLAVPIPEGVFGDANTVTLAAGESTTMPASIGVMNVANDAAIVSAFGGVVRIGDGDPVLVVGGAGKVLVRLGNDGKPFLEAEDPRAVALVPTKRSLAECAPEILAPPFDEPPSLLLDDADAARAPRVVQSIVRGDDGCRTFSIGDGVMPSAEVRACIPDEAYPFAEDDVIHVRANVTSRKSEIAEIVFEDDNGHALALERLGFVERVSNWIVGLEVALDETPTCGHVEPVCGDLEVPARISARTGDGVIHQAAFREPIAAADGVTFYVLGATSHPIIRTSCSHDGNDDTAPIRAHAWIAKVTK